MTICSWGKTSDLHIYNTNSDSLKFCILVRYQRASLETFRLQKIIVDAQNQNTEISEELLDDFEKSFEVINLPEAGKVIYANSLISLKKEVIRLKNAGFLIEKDLLQKISKLIRSNQAKEN